MPSKRSVKFGLQYKITILIFSLLIISLSSIVTYYMSMNWRESIADMKVSAMRATKILGAMWPFAYTKEGTNWPLYESYMKQIAGVEKSILCMAIVDDKGNVTASIINDKLMKEKFASVKFDADKTKAIKELTDNNINDVLKLVGKFKTKGKDVQLATLVIKYSKFDLYHKQNVMVLNTMLLAMLVLVIGWLGAWYLAKFITTNFNIIVAGMRKVAEGNLDVEVNVRSNDEVGVLADDFNSMIVELKQKVRIKDAFETVADGLKEMDDIKKAYKTLTFQQMTDKLTKGYAPHSKGDENRTVFVFIDTSAFMGFTYELMSEEMKVIIDKLVEKISMTALEYQGAVFKVTEKYILLSFGYPFNHKDDLRRALISTVEIRKELVQMVKAKLTLGYTVEDFGVNFIMIGGNVAGNFADKISLDKFDVIKDYLAFASKYGAKKQYATDIYATQDIADGTSTLAMYDRVDSVAMREGGNIELLKLKGTKF
jgi:HAMP domain-containing protein